MTPDSLRDMFAASAGVAGALIGLLFVAISIEHERLTARDADQVDRVRARAALTAFVNALSVSLFALIGNDGLPNASIAVGTVGILFVLASALSVRRLARTHRTRTGRLRDLTFLILQLAVFVGEILLGVRLGARPHDRSAADTIASLVVISFLIGIYRSWELIGGAEIGLTHELRELVHARDEDE